MAEGEGFEDEGTLVLEQRFAIVPEWSIDAQVSDCAFRLYAVLRRVRGATRRDPIRMCELHTCVGTERCGCS